MIDPSAICLGMTAHRIKLALEHPDGQRQMTRMRDVKLSDGEGRRFQPHITVGEPITYTRPLFLIDPKRGSGGKTSA